LQNKILHRIHINPGELFTSNEPHEISTILGSCVAVCIWDRQNRFGGMNHFMLPHCTDLDKKSNRYGNIAMQELLRQILEMGSRRSNLVIKAFGGSSVLSFQTGSFEIGKQNREEFEKWLDQTSLKLVASNMGGKLGRKIVFNTATGEVKMSFINSSGNK